MEKTKENKINDVLDNCDNSDVEYYIEKITEYFKTDKTDKYFKEVPIIENKINFEKINFSSKIGNLKNKEEILKYFKSNPIIDQIYDDIDLYHKCIDLQEFINGSKPENECNGIKTWFKYEEILKSVTICGGSIIECDLFHLFAVLSEIDLMKQFISQYEDITKVAEVSPFRWLMHIKLKMPLTFTNRDLICTGFGLTNKEDKSILITFKSVDKFLDLVIPEETSKHKRISVHFGYYHIQYISENKYYLSCAFNVDIKIPIIPWFIMNKCMKKSTYYIIEGLKKQIYDPKAKEIYHKRVEEKKEYYEMIRKGLDILN